MKTQHPLPVHTRHNTETFVLIVTAICQPGKSRQYLSAKVVRQDGQPLGANNSLLPYSDGYGEFRWRIGRSLILVQGSRGWLAACDYICDPCERLMFAVVSALLLLI
jgi:hypothetical protein